MRGLLLLAMIIAVAGEIASAGPAIAEHHARQDGERRTADRPSGESTGPGTHQPSPHEHAVAVGAGRSVHFAQDPQEPHRTVFSVRHTGREVGLLGFDLAYEGKELAGQVLRSRREEKSNGLVITQEPKGSGRILYTATAERGPRGIGVAVNLKSAPGLMTHVLPAGHTARVKRLFFGPGIVAHNVRRPATLNKGFYCSSLALEFDNGLFEFQHISQPPRFLQIDPQKNLYGFELKRTLDESGDVITSHGEWDRVSDDVTYTYYFTDDFMDGINYLREKLRVPKSEVTRRLIGMQHLNLSFFGSQGGRRGHDRDHVRSEGFESVRFCMDLFIRGMTDLFIQGCRNNDNADLFRLCDRYGALKSIYQQYGGVNPVGVGLFDNGWVRVEVPPLTKKDLYHCAHPERHAGGFHPQRIHGVQGHGDYKDFPVIAPHALPGLVRSHREAVKKAYNINSIYQDVISGDIGGGYWDSQGRYVRAQEAVKCLREFFQENRAAYGPVLTEFAEEAYFGYADAAYPSYVFGAPAMGIQADDWEFFPFKGLLYHDVVVLYGVGTLCNYKAGWKSKAEDFVLSDQERAYGDLVRDARSTAILFGHPAHLGVMAADTGCREWKGKDTDLTFYLKNYYLHHQFHKQVGLKRMTGFAFDSGNLHRHRVEYEDGTRVWVNRSKDDWTVEGHILPTYGFLIQGKGLLEYSALADAASRQWVDYVDTEEEIYADPMGRWHDFGKVATDTQLVVQRLSRGVVKIIPYPCDRPGVIHVRLERIENGWDYRATRLKAYDGVGRFLGQPHWEHSDGLRFRPDAVPGAVFYVTHLESVDPRVRWDIGTDLKAIRDGQYTTDNLVESPGFEEEWYGLHGWMKNPDPIGVETRIDRAQRRSGACSFKIRFTGARISGYKQMYQWLRVEPGQQYRLRYSIKTEGLTQGVGLTVGKSVGVLYPWYRVIPDLRVEPAHYVRGTTDWRLVETRFTPQERDVLLVVHTLGPATVSGTVWIDDVEVTKVR